jgi:hypothetical protein
LARFAGWVTILFLVDERSSDVASGTPASGSGHRRERDPSAAVPFTSPIVVVGGAMGKYSC